MRVDWYWFLEYWQLQQNFLIRPTWSGWVVWNVLISERTDLLMEPWLFANPFQLKTGITPEKEKNQQKTPKKLKILHLTLMEAASAALTVSFTALFSFWALNTSMSIASWWNIGQIICQLRIQERFKWNRSNTDVIIDIQLNYNLYKYLIVVNTGGTIKIQVTTALKGKNRWNEANYSCSR